MPRSASLFVFFLCTALAAGPALAQQQEAQTFTSSRRGGGQDFTYTYPAGTLQPQTLQFRLNLDDITRGSAEFQPWNDREARADAVQDAETAATSMQKPDLQIIVEPIPGGMNMRVRGTNPALRNQQFMQQISDALQPYYDKGLKEYATAHYYRMVPTGPNSSSIMPDHPVIAKRYTAAMGPVARAIQAQVPGAADSPRNFINAAMAWLQTIPYDTLEDRATSNGAGFQTPYGLMLGNRGDCDTKTTALAALIRAAYPSIPLVMIYVPDHAFLGIGLPQESTDYALRTEYGMFILADATGPRREPLGFIDENTRARVLSNHTDLLPIR